MIRAEPFAYSEAVATAMLCKQPVLALESAVITHGLPRPANLDLARALEEEAKAEGVVPATIALLDGRVQIGLSDEQLIRLGEADEARKISRKDFGIALARKEAGGTTVAGTLIAARAVGIRVFSTGGIGGVHRDAPQDVSADLPELGRSPLVVVCAGAKAILDLPATLEYLETAGVGLIGYQTDEFPAFYSRRSGLPVDVRVDCVDEVAAIARQHWNIGLDSALLVVAPPPLNVALPMEQVEAYIQAALREAREQGIRGSRVTPFLLNRVAELSQGASLEANLALLRQNARLGAQIAKALVS